MADKFIPITTMTDLYSLDGVELAEGYMKAREGYVITGNESRSFIHGWRNGLVDAGVCEPDEAQLLLAVEQARLLKAARRG